MPGVSFVGPLCRLVRQEKIHLPVEAYGYTHAAQMTILKRFKMPRTSHLWRIYP
jgi:hypothetical protein